MNWSRLRRMAFSLPLALLAVVLLVGANEAGFRRSQKAADALARSHATRAALDQLLQSMLNAETGQRGYLLTQDERYLQPYKVALTSINSHLETLRATQGDALEDRADFAQLSQAISRRLSEMELTIKLRRQDNDDAWRFVLSTDVGQEDMEAVRALASRMTERSAQQAARSTDAIRRALLLSRAGVALAAVVGLLAFYLYLRNGRALRAAHEREQRVLARERDRLEQLVRERTASLSELAHHLQQVREEERAHLARELHDELGALLTAAKLDVARLRPRIDLSSPESAERLDHLTDSLNSGIALKRRIIEDLRPSSLSNLGLTTTLEILTREFAERSGIRVDTHLASVQLSESAQLTVYRLVQEALTNIHKHAHARHVVVSLGSSAHQVTVQVRDDGMGFLVDQVPSDAHGLLGMRHRVEIAGGRLAVTSKPGEGALVSAVLPLSSTAPSA